MDYWPNFSCLCVPFYFLALCFTVTTHWIIFLDDDLVAHVVAWMARETVDHFARQCGGGVYGAGDP